ncbi:MAG: hypothetical protein K5870_11835 [Lachnospiraceae bacterium]|nr:hypothetical protein [Lachnospiraceae bacterium]
MFHLPNRSSISSGSFKLKRAPSMKMLFFALFVFALLIVSQFSAGSA